MYTDFSWNSSYTEQSIILLLITVSYIIYHYFLKSDRFLTLLKGKYKDDKVLEYSVHLQRILGGITLAFIPSFFLVFFRSESLINYGLSINNIGKSLIYTISLLVIILPLVYISTKKSEQQDLYPQIRCINWTKKMYIKSFFSWSIYMFGYELMFRGLLLFSLAKLFDVWPALMIMTAIYVAVHLPKTASETIGCIPIGIIFGIMALSTGSILAPFLIHTFIGATSEFFSIKHNPSMNFL